LRVAPLLRAAQDCQEREQLGAGRTFGTHRAISCFTSASAASRSSMSAVASIEALGYSL
jgi:hypothetical protein